MHLFDSCGPWWIWCPGREAVAWRPGGWPGLRRLPKDSWIPALALPLSFLGLGSLPDAVKLDHDLQGKEAPKQHYLGTAFPAIHLFAFGRESSWAQHHQVLRIEGLAAVTLA